MKCKLFKDDIDVINKFMEGKDIERISAIPGVDFIAIFYEEVSKNEM